MNEFAIVFLLTRQDFKQQKRNVPRGTFLKTEKFLLLENYL